MLRLSCSFLAFLVLNELRNNPFSTSEIYSILIFPLWSVSTFVAIQETLHFSFTQFVVNCALKIPVTVNDSAIAVTPIKTSREASRPMVDQTVVKARKNKISFRDMKNVVF